jgi:cyclic beta-1,2-glucan synthetase
VRGATLRIEPRVPESWPSFTIDYQFGTTLYNITVQEPGTLARTGAEVLLHGVPLEGEEIPLVDDGMDHTVLVRPAATRS